MIHLTNISSSEEENMEDFPGLFTPFLEFNYDFSLEDIEFDSNFSLGKLPTSNGSQAHLTSLPNSYPKGCCGEKFPLIPFLGANLPQTKEI
jgi:hypothetical protein